MKKFLKNVKQEMKKIKWPSRKDMIKYSIATLTIILFFCMFFIASDVLISDIEEVVFQVTNNGYVSLGEPGNADCYVSSYENEFYCY